MYFACLHTCIHRLLAEFAGRQLTYIQTQVLPAYNFNYDCYYASHKHTNINLKALLIMEWHLTRVYLFTVDLLKPESTVIIRNAKIDMFKGSMRLAVDKWGRIEVTEPASFNVKEDNNLSLVEYELVNVTEEWRPCWSHSITRISVGKKNSTCRTKNENLRRWRSLWSRLELLGRTSASSSLSCIYVYQWILVAAAVWLYEQMWCAEQLIR